MSDNQPKDPDLWESILDLARGKSNKPVKANGKTVNPVNDGKGFTTWPSAYGVGWALAQYKRLNGKWETKKKSSTLPSVQSLVSELERKYEGLTLFMGEPIAGDKYTLPIVRFKSIHFPKEKRGQGYGSSVMLEIKRWADKNNMMIALTPSKDLGGSSVARLKRFYGQFGYKSNKGRNKDFRVMETMVYDPSKNKRASDLDLSLKWDRERLMSKTSEEMEFSDKLFCRSYKDYHKKRDEDARRGLIVRIASLYMRGVMARVSKRDKKDLKNTGHGGLDTWFAGHGGGKPDDRATWGDWIAVTPVKHTITKEDGSKKEYEPGDIVGPCAVSSQKEWSDVTSGGKKPLKCMPRSKAYQMSKDERASLARKKRREENKHRGQKPVNTPTFSDEAKEIRDRAKKKADFNQRILIPDPPKTEELLDELPLISEQYENRFNPSHLQDDLDKGSEHLFATLIESRLGILVSPESIKRVMLDIREPIHHHKNYFNSKRPQLLADEYDIPFQSDYLSSAQTPSYPSGHTTQAYFIAYVLSDKFPSIRVDFFNVANMVAQSRIDRGVHFLSDNESGKILAKALYQERAQTKKKADFYRQVSAPDSLSSYSNGTPVHRHQDGKEESSSLPTGDTARNIGRPSPDSPNLKYRNLDRSESYGRTPANKLDLGYVHDSGSGSARVIPYDSGFENNSSPLRNAHRRISKD